MADAAFFPSSSVNACMLHAVAALLRAELAHRAFFQRKPPGLRWRIETPDRRRALDTIAPTLQRMKEVGDLTDWHVAVYEPEKFSFGGAAAMDAVHDYFAADSSAWLQLSAVGASDPTMSGSMISTAQLNELFARALDGSPEEIWDVWCRLAVFHGLQPARERHAHERPMLRDIPQPSAALLHVLQALASANAALAGALVALYTRGELLQGLRGVLALVALFHWNRIGLRPERRRQVLQAMTEAWHPHVAPASVAQFR
jgi:thiopeptide-type bacteriocin biosynthesis protein